MSADKVTVGWIDSGSVTSGFAAYVAQILLHRSDKIDNVLAASGPYLSANRNKMVLQFLETDSEWLLSLDSDLLIDLESFDTLLSVADEKEYPIVGGKYYLPLKGGLLVAAQAWHPEVPGGGVFIDETDISTTDLMIDDLHSLGGGYLLIHRTVYETILNNSTNPMPWFKDYYEDYPYDAWISDDIHFFKLVHENGFKTALCTKATSQHLKTTILGDFQYLSFKEQQSKEFNSHTNHKRKSWVVKGKK
jgi:hypothetical protein